MPSEYQKWIARDVKKEEVRERTKKEKFANWWYYHWWQIGLCLLAVVLTGTFLSDWTQSKNNQPDCQIAYIGSFPLPTDTVTALEENLAPLIGDVDQNGKIIVHIRQYTVASGGENGTVSNPNEQMALMAQMAAKDNFLFLLEDPAAFQARFGLLTLPDGTYQEDPSDDATPLWYAWSDCPALAELPLGDFKMDLGGEEPIIGSSDELLSKLYIGRSSIPKWSPEQAETYSEIWKNMIAGVK